MVWSSGFFEVRGFEVTGSWFRAGSSGFFEVQGFGVSLWLFGVSHFGGAIFKVSRLRFGVFEVQGFSQS